jgi:hypothetical protein
MRQQGSCWRRARGGSRTCSGWRLRPSGVPGEQDDDGTLTFITTHKGLPEKLSIPGGPALSRDAGVVTLANTVRPLPNGEFEDVSLTVSGEHGPHPELDTGFGLFCDVLVPALT